MERDLSKYYLAVISAFTIYGLFSLPLKALDGYASLDILLSRIAISSLVLIFFSFTVRRKTTLANIKLFKSFDSKTRKKLWLINVLSAVFLAINWYLFIYVMNRVSVNATSLAYMLCPIITTVLAYIFLKDRLSPIQWTAVLLSLGSCLMLAAGHLSEVFYSFIVGFSYAVYLVLQKPNHQLDRFFTLTFQIAVSMIFLLPFWNLQEALPEKGVFFYSIILTIAILFTIIPMYLNVFALNRLSSSTAGIFIYLNPILSFLLAVFYFHEPIGVIKVIAYSVVFFSVILFNWDFIRVIVKKSSRKQR